MKIATIYHYYELNETYKDNFIYFLNTSLFDEIEYLLNGGDVMKKWVNYTLDEARKSVHGTKSARKNAGMENQFRSDSEDNLTPSTPVLKKAPEFMSTSDLMEEINKINEINKKLN